MASVDREYLRRQASLEREAARQSKSSRAREMHENAARLYEALAFKADP